MKQIYKATKNRFECIHEDLENDLYQQFVLDCAIWHELRDFENIIPNTIILEVCSYACTIYNLSFLSSNNNYCNCQILLDHPQTVMF